MDTTLLASREDEVLVQQVNTANDLTKWVMTNNYYSIWGYVHFMCEYGAYWQLLAANDGGRFYNECYHMFIDGV